VPLREFWHSLTQADQADFLRRGITRRFDRGQALFHANQVPDRVVLLRSGRVKITSTTATGREAVLAFREPGELVGELAASTTAASACNSDRAVEVVSLARSDFLTSCVSIQRRRSRSFAFSAGDCAVPTPSAGSQRQHTSRRGVCRARRRFGEKDGDVVRILARVAGGARG
jgi:hypothetical protein